MGNDGDLNRNGNCVSVDNCWVSSAGPDVLIEDLRHPRMHPSPALFVGLRFDNSESMVAEICEWAFPHVALSPASPDALVNPNDLVRGNKVGLSIAPGDADRLRKFIPDWQIVREQVFRGLRVGVSATA
jgi:hypothetical protein